MKNYSNKGKNVISCLVLSAWFRKADGDITNLNNLGNIFITGSWTYSSIGAPSNSGWGGFVQFPLNGSDLLQFAVKWGSDRLSFWRRMRNGATNWSDWKE